MKKIILGLVTAFIATNSFAQMMIQLDGKFQGIGAISSSSNSRTGTTTEKSSAGAIQAGFGLGFSKSLTENIVGTLNVTKLSGSNWGGSDSLTYDLSGQSWIGIEPGANYFFNELFDGVYAGGKLGFKMGMDDGSFSTASIMARGGKIFSISDAIKFGLEAGLGYELGFGKKIGNYSYSGPSGINWGLGLYFGYVFGSN